MNSTELPTKLQSRKVLSHKWFKRIKIQRQNNLVDSIKYDPNDIINLNSYWNRLTQMVYVANILGHSKYSARYSHRRCFEINGARRGSNLIYGS